MNTGEWLDEQMAGLQPAREWQPDAARALARVRERGRKASTRRRAWGWATAAASTACLVVLVVPATRAAVYRACTAACAVVWPSLLEESGELAAAGAALGSAPDTESIENRPAVAAAPANSPAADSPGSVLRGPRPAPDFALRDADGRLIQLSDYRGQVVLVNFWATWCRPCKIEMPWFTDLQRKYENRGFTVIAVSLDEEGFAAVQPFADALQLNFPVVIGNDELARKFGDVAALPMTYLVDKEGSIRSEHAGLVSPAEYEERIEKLL